jgi:two-component system OmpR family sensor kinase
MPIRIRLALFAALGALVLSSLGAFVFVHQLRGQLHTSVDSSLRVRADALVQSLGDAASGLDFQDAGSTALVSDKEAIVQIVGPDGRVAEASQAAGSTLLLSPGTLRTAATKTVYAEGRIPRDGHAVRFLATPVTRSDGRWTVVVGTSLASADEAVARVRTGLALGVALVTLASAIGAWLLSRLALRPVERMRRQAAAISERDADTRLAVPKTHDEIAQLGVTMNALLGRLQNALTQQRAFVADASHELRTPLAILRTELELAAHPGRDLVELRRAIANAGDETDRLVGLAEELLFLARHDEDRTRDARELQPLRPLLERSADRARRNAQGRDADVSVVVDAPTDLAAGVVADDLSRAVENLLDNAIRHAPPASCVRLDARRDHAGVVISVSDHGPGFPIDFLPHAFERFRRADSGRASDDGGTGLGLAIVRAVARGHGGDAEAGNLDDGGARVAIRLPAD